MPVLPGLSADGRADQILAAYVIGNYFTALRVKPALGRLIQPSEENQPGKTAVLVLGYSYWQKRFGGDPGVIGKQVRVNGKPAIIIGVVPRRVPGHLCRWLELDMLYAAEQRRDASSRAGPCHERSRVLERCASMARLKPGVSLPTRRQSMNVIAAREAKQYPSTDGKTSLCTVYREQLARPVAAWPTIMVLAIARFLLSPCRAGSCCWRAMNVANVLLARATVRQREMGLRAALGAGRGRLMRQMLTETVLLGLLGGALGTLIGEWANPGDVSKVVSSGLPIHLDYSFDWHVFVYSLAAALFTGILVGLWPAFRASRAGLNGILTEGGRSDTAGNRRHRLRRVLVIGQVAGSLTLLIVAGLFVRSLRHAETMYLGFDPGHLLNLRMNPHEIGYGEDRTKEFYRRLEERARSLPGVQSVSLACGVPMGSINVVNTGSVTIEGQPLRPDQQPPTVFYNNVDSGYFDTMKVALLRGRAFTDLDNENAPPVAIVNQIMADRFWPHEDPIGKRFSLKTTTESPKILQVVAVAANGKYLFIAEDPTPFFYVPLAQNYFPMRALQVRSSVPPETLLAPLQAEVHKLAPDLPIIEAQTMDQTIRGRNGLLIFRIGAKLASEIGVIALMLAIVGLYGIVSFTATQRTREIGIRMALGGSAGGVLRLILRQGVRMVVIGLAVGLLAALGITRLMTRLLIGISPSDPLTYAAVALLLSAVALLACWLPARRATRVDPSVALRYE